MTTVRDAMLRRPTVHPADLTVGQAQAELDAHPKRHMLVLVADGVLTSTITRSDLHSDVDPNAEASTIGTLIGRTVGPDGDVEDAHRAMLLRGHRRVAVVDEHMHLLGLLCLKRSRSGFCTDAGVAALRAERRRSAS